MELGQRYGRTPAPIVRRWMLQRESIVIPQSSHRERRLENRAIFDFSPSDADMAGIAALDTGRSTSIDDRDRKVTRMPGTMTIHD